jgi:hypothetical protein
MSDFKVVSAVKTGSYDSQYGEDVDGKKVMFKYAVELEGESDAVEVSQKPSTPQPKAGDVLSGTIETSKYGRKFTKEKKGNFGGGAATVSPDVSNKQAALTVAAQSVGAYFHALAEINPERASKEFPKDIKEFVGVENALAVLHLKFLGKSTEELTGVKVDTQASVNETFPGGEEVHDEGGSVNKLDL